MKIEISCSQWEGSACTQSALIFFLLSFGWGDDFFIFPLFPTSSIQVLIRFPMCFPKVFPIAPRFNPILVWPVPLAQVLPLPQLIFPCKTWFFGIHLNFQQEKLFKNQYLPHSESKSYQINSIKSCSSRSFQQHQSQVPIPPKFSTTI